MNIYEQLEDDGDNSFDDLSYGSLNKLIKKTYQEAHAFINIFFRDIYQNSEEKSKCENNS